MGQNWLAGATTLAISVGAALVGAGPAISASAAIKAVGVENQYADVIAQIGGRYIDATAIISDPNTDPHTFEASPKIAASIAAAQLIVKNGVGYDAWVEKIMSASPNPGRKVIDVQQLMGLPNETPNPHLWYDPKTMPAVAKAIADDLSALEPEHAKVFEANLETFDASLKPWTDAIAAFKAEHPKTPIAVTEPVADYMLDAMGFAIETPFPLQAAIMNGTDPAPQDVSTQTALFTGSKVKVFAYNQQVTSALTKNYITLAKTNDVPIVGVYETMPTPGYSYQSWMLAEVDALRRAVTSKISTETLQKK